MNRFRRILLCTGLALVLIGLAPAASLPWPGCEVDWFTLAVTGDTVTLTHGGVPYNCCLERIDWTVQLEGSTLRIFEYEFVPEPCLCLCCYELSVSVADCPPGLLEVEVHYDDYDAGGWVTWTGTIFVPDVGQTEPPAIAANETSDCLTADAAGEPLWSTWGRLKALYRVPPVD